MRRHALPPRIRALEVTEASHNIESLRVSREETFCFFESWMPERGSDFPSRQLYHCTSSRVVLTEAVDWLDWCICFTRKIQHGGDWERSLPKNVHNFLMTERPLSWACRHGTEMLLILKYPNLTWLFSDIFRYDSPKKCPTILFTVNLWLKPV